MSTLLMMGTQLEILGGYGIGSAIFYIACPFLICGPRDRGSDTQISVCALLAYASVCVNAKRRHKRIGKEQPWQPQEIQFASLFVAFAVV